MYLLVQVSYSLLIFFCGMFITVEGFDRTGIPSSLWNLMEPYAGINHVSGITVLASPCHPSLVKFGFKSTNRYAHVSLF